MTVAVLTLRAPGWVRRVASAPVTITGDDSGAPTFALPGLTGFEPPSDEVDLLAADRSELPNARVYMQLEPGECGAQMESTLGHLAASVGDLDLYDEGDDWSERVRLISRGVVSHMALDDEDLAARFTLEASNPAVGASVGDASRDMGDYFGGTPTGTGTGGTIGYPSLVGRQWPVIVGIVSRVPGHRLGLINPSGDGITYVPALGLCGHHIAQPAQDYAIYSGSTAYTAAGTTSIVNAYDDGGGPYACIVSDDSADFGSGDDAFSVDLPGGGVGGNGGSAAVDGGAVVRWFMQQSGIAIDWIRSEPALRQLAGFRLGVYIDDELDALRVLRERLIAVLPLIEETGPEGLWLRWTEYRTAPTRTHLEEGAQLIGFAGPLTQDSDPDKLYNRFVANYAYNHDTGAYDGRLVIDETSHPGCAVGRANAGGVRVSPDLDLSITDDAATAARILTNLADRQAVHRWTRDAILDPSVDVDAGDIVTVTSARAGWTRRRCLVRVRAPRRTGEPVAVTLEPLPIFAVHHG